VIGHWQTAIANFKAIKPQEARYETAQEKILEYQNYLSYAEAALRQTGGGLTLKKTITGGLTPKSVVYSGNNLFFAQNMMYSHTVGIYNGEYQLVKTLSDQINLGDYGHKEYAGKYQGSPVEATFSHGGQWAWVSNYQMYGPGFNRPGADTCSPASNHDHSYVYRINTQQLTIDQAIKVGAVPKFLAASPDDRYVLVSNWCGYDVSVIDTTTNQEIKKIKLGAYPRGIAIAPDSQIAYVAIMGSTKIAKINLTNFEVDYIEGVGSAPRHLVIDPVEGRYLYVTLNNEGQVGQIDLTRDRVIKKVRTGSAPRSMTISDDGQFLYVVNYSSNTMSKVRAKDLKPIQTVPTNGDPIGITYNPDRREVWVACYSGSLMVFQD
jgi:YVTN family beta-propeller protein